MYMMMYNVNEMYNVCICVYVSMYSIYIKMLIYIASMYIEMYMYYLMYKLCIFVLNVFEDVNVIYNLNMHMI